MPGGYSLGVATGTIVIAYDGAGAKKAKADLAGVEAAGTKSKGSLTKAAGTMAKSGAIIAAGLAVAVHAATDFQSKMNLLVTAAGESPKAIGKVSEGIKRIAVETGTSLDHLAEGMYLAEKAGYRGADGLNVLRVAAEGAKAENVDMTTFTSALTSVMTSYSYKAQDATKVTNMLVVAAGRSKTTMQEFAGSLATVLPIASALHISFPQVAGAISVLTQHGTSAREATQELANLIRNLAGQNNVASAAMQQLGINTVDLQKNFGKRGLSGTLAIVTQALQKSSKGGMIVVDAFKKSALATQSLQTMFKAMPPDLKALTQQFNDGGIGLTDYRKAVKDLTGPQAAMGIQYLALYQNSQAFNNALKSGNGDISTAANTLQKMLGGATGLRTALQLGVGTENESSASAKLLAENIKAVGDAGKHGGKDIETWAKTQKTTAVQVDKLKSSVQVFAVNLGATLLPAVNTIIHGLVLLFTALANLPGPIKGVVAYGALAAASLLLLGATLIKLIDFAKKFGGAMKAMWGAMQSGFRVITQLLTKLGLIQTAEAKTAASAEIAAAKHAEAQAATAKAYETGVARVQVAQDRLVAAEEAAAAAANGSAAEQEAAAARVATAKERLATVASSVEANIVAAEEAEATAAQASATATQEAEAAKVAAMERTAVAAESASATVAEAEAAQAASVRAASTSIAASSATSAAAMRGAGGAAAAGGASRGLAGLAGTAGGLVTVMAVVGLATNALAKKLDGASTKKFKAELEDFKNVLKTVKASEDAFTDSYSLNYNAARKAQTATAAAAVASIGLDKATKSSGLTQSDLAQAIVGTTAQWNKAVSILKTSGTYTDEVRFKMEQLRQKYLGSADAAKKNAIANQQALPYYNKTVTATQLLNGSIVNLTKTYGGVTQSQAAFHSATDALTASVATNGKTLDQNSLFGRNNATAIREAATAALAHAQAVYQQTGSVSKSLGVLSSDRTALINAATAAGLNKDQVKKLVDSINTIPAKKSTTVTVNTQAAKDAVDGFGAWLDSRIAAINSHAHVTVSTNTNKSGLPALPGATRSVGGWVPGSSSSVWQGAVHGREYVLSEEMLRGRGNVDPRVLDVMSKYQMKAAGQPAALSGVATRVYARSASKGLTPYAAVGSHSQYHDNRSITVHNAKDRPTEQQLREYQHRQDVLHGTGKGVF